tara:strand:+ start:1329 stop:2042 length:714 start_codon:yes stop_codon:yes gene_type:complete
MTRKINTRIIKLKKYYSLINHKLIFKNETINRYKKSLNLSEKKLKYLKDLKDDISAIKNCDLKKFANSLVFSDGNPNSKIMIIGEAPGANEDKEGLPFVGRAGILLDKMLASIKLDRTKVYISNVVNFRPPENRKPSENEISRYLPFLLRHIEIINPKIILLLGSTALNALIGRDTVISKARGKWYKKTIGNANPFVIASFHPAFLMRQPDQKKLAWIDLKMIRTKISELDLNIPKK